jgi:clan AA aspartic protease (TIGR02281 family)
MRLKAFPTPGAPDRGGRPVIVLLIMSAQTADAQTLIAYPDGLASQDNPGKRFRVARRLPRIAMLALFVGAPIALERAAFAGEAPIESRAALLVGVTGEGLKPRTTLGHAVWSLVPAGEGQPVPAVRIEIEIPDQKIHATVTIRNGADAGVQASQTIDFAAVFAEGAAIAGVADVGVPQLRDASEASGEPLAGVRTKVGANHYLVALSGADREAAQNRTLLAKRGWIDFPLQLSDGRIAKLAVEKDGGGDRLLTLALAASAVASQSPPVQNYRKFRFSEKVKSDRDEPNGSASGDDASEIPVLMRNGMFVAQGSINNGLTLDFIIDSGATSVVIPADVLDSMMEAGTVVHEDLLGKKNFRLADGSIVPGETFRIRILRVGNRQMENVVAGVTKAKGPLLLGQSFLGRFRSWSIDNEHHLLVLK